MIGLVQAVSLSAQAWLATWSLAMGEPTEPGQIPPDTGYLQPHGLPPVPTYGEDVDDLIGVARPEDQKPGTRVGDRILELLEDVLADTAELPDEQHRYDHRFRVNRTLRIYHWDCSQMLSGVLRHKAPKAWKAVGTDKPVAWHYYRTIVTAPLETYVDGWRKIEHIEDVRPGDVFAWRRPDSWPMGASSGHVGFVHGTPTPVPTLERAYLVRIIDATSEVHQEDSRADGQRTGLGEGTMLFLTDPDGAVVAYGWEGIDSTIWVRTDVQFGRVIG